MKSTANLCYFISIFAVDFIFFVIYMKTPCSANLRLCKPFRIIILNQ